MFVHLMAVFNQLAHGCGNLTVLWNCKELTSWYTSVSNVNKCVWCSANHCVLFGKKCEADVVIIVVHIWADVLLT